MNRDLLKQKLIEYGIELGFDLIRVTTADPLRLWDLQVGMRRERDPE